MFKAQTPFEVTRKGEANSSDFSHFSSKPINVCTGPLIMWPSTKWYVSLPFYPRMTAVR